MTPQPPSPFISYPQRALVEKPIAKTTLYKNSAPNTKIKNLFSDQVKQIVWQYRLSPDTTNLSKRPEVPEIHIIVLRLKVAKLDHTLLRQIDDVIPYPIIFELYFEDQVQMLAAYKQPKGVGDGYCKVQSYFTSAWLPENTERLAMPYALDLGGLYGQILQGLIPIPPRPAEGLADLVQRADMITTKKAEIERVRNKIPKLPFHQQIETRQLLAQLQAERSQLERLKP